MPTFSELDWSIVPGPLVLPAPVYPSDQVQSDLVLYHAARVAQVIERLPGVTIDSSGDGDWWDWKATYEGEQDLFELNMTLFDTQPPCWGGSDLVGVIDAEEARDFWLRLLALLPGTYLHSSEALLYTLEGFTEAFLPDL